MEIQLLDRERGGGATGAVRHLITPEYPPQRGGVSDYTWLVAEGLAGAGEDVHVWCPALTGPSLAQRSVHVHRELGGLTPADLRNAGEQLDRFPAPRRILVQWVPHGYGYRSMNLPFCAWLWSRARRGDRIEIMVHEAFLPFGGSSRQSAAALVHRVMTSLLLRSAERVWVSVPECERRWKPYALGRRVPFQWLPVPSNIEVVPDAQGIQAVRDRYFRGGLLLGHFGTYGAPVASVLEPVLLDLARDPSKPIILLMGMSSQEFRARMIEKSPTLADQLHATGPLSAVDLSRHLSGCDLLIQPYPDGASTRRGSLMACLAHGKPIVTTFGHVSERLWTDAGAVAIAPAGNTDEFVKLINRLSVNGEERIRLGREARQLYLRRFDVSHTVAVLLGSPGNLVCAS